MAGEKILIVDNELNIIELLKYNLEVGGYRNLYAQNRKDRLNLAMEKKPDLILLDVMLPEIYGFDVCKEIKRNKETESIPIIMLTVKGYELDKILGLELGADDYSTKPFSVRETIARIKAVLRRNFKEDQGNGKCSCKTLETEN